MTEKISEETLKLMHLIQEDSKTSQRELAIKSGLSLGKINYVLSSLVDIGYIKVKNFKNSDNKLNYKYILTPRGIKDKTKITKNFITKKKEEFDILLSYLDES